MDGRFAPPSARKLTQLETNTRPLTRWSLRGERDGDRAPSECPATDDRAGVQVRSESVTTAATPRRSRASAGSDSPDRAESTAIIRSAPATAKLVNPGSSRHADRD